MKKGTCLQHTSRLLAALIFKCAIIALALSSTAFADPGTSACAAPDITLVDQPVFPGQRNSETFKLAFKYRMPQAGYPTVLYIAGGPGMPAISDDFSSYPDGYGVVMVDPRGIGCSDPARTFPKGALVSKYIVADIRAVVERIALKNYIVHGVSYGTVVGTALVYQLQDSARAPSALVLEGTLGRAYQGPELSVSQNSIWENVKLQLPQKIQDELNAEIPPLGLASDIWGTTILNSLYPGAIPGSKSIAVRLLTMLESDDPQVREALKRAVLKNGANDPFGGNQNALQMYREVVCSEIFRTATYKTLLKKGRLVDEEPVCADEKYSNRFDAKAWQIKNVPIFYLQGEADVATPEWQAKYHFETQTLTARFFIEFKGLGHSISNRLAICKEKLWKSFFDQGQDLASTIHDCGLPESIVVGQKSP